MNKENITEMAIRAVGTPSVVSRMFGFSSPQSVFNWIKNNKVPAERVIQLCQMGKWSFCPHQLRPDLYPNEFDGLPKDSSVSNFK
ncbi:YdaS family helix-turn-helix protein [Moellerella wisconsensis]|uniref:Helix-turn-helix domain-containing protein n=1 Tax=Moellerella wisconsensis TaxID=158849 RepID=A0A9Q8V4C8_9GAMM|nr:YdaS family helix-turn-helix protein [Moellerella wisconsensis]UNH31833.1 helix-turn-helix domain-containing protein [Moellerella wisconsensis]UNH43509.1 helix-turn-helix domain-containing protein [Moellerella wisconsensis]